MFNPRHEIKHMQTPASIVPGCATQIKQLPHEDQAVLHRQALHHSGPAELPDFLHQFHSGLLPHHKKNLPLRCHLHTLLCSVAEMLITERECECC